MYKVKTNIAPIAPNAMTRTWTPFICRANIYTVPYNWLRSTGTTCVIERAHEDLDAKRLGIEHV